MNLNDATLCDFLKGFGINTWNRIGFSYNRNTLNTHEVTLTENLVYHLYMLGQSVYSNIQIYEALDETANGNDLEIFINHNGRLLWFPTQAKIIKPKNGRYETISYKVGKPPVQQIRLLHNYADKYKSHGITGFPLYLFYNYLQSPHLPTIPSNVDVEEYGTSIVSEKYIYDTYSPYHTYPPQSRWKKIPTFADLHFEHALPLYNLCSLMNGNSTSIAPIGLTEHIISEMSTPYSENLIANLLPESNWSSLISSAEIGKMSNTNNSLSRLLVRNDREEEVFKPKFALILTNTNTGVKINSEH